MRTSLAAALLLAVIPAAAQTVAPPQEAPTEQGTRERLEAFQKERAERMKKLAPVEVEKAAVRTLFDRLAKDGMYERSEGERAIGVRLIEVETPEPEGPVRDLLYRRTFSHIEASEQVIKDSKEGASADIYTYTIGLDGTLLKVQHSQLTIVGATPEGQIVVDPKKSRVLELPPKDMKARWSRLSKELLKLGKTISV